MPGLVNGKFRAIRQADRGQQPPALIGDIPRHFGSLAPQLGQGGQDVVAHEVELVMALAVSGMNSELGRGQGENEPASARVRRRHAEHVSEERTDLLGLRGEHDGVHSGYHAAILTADAWGRTEAPSCVEAGGHQWSIASPGSYRATWFELHEDLLVTLRIPAPGQPPRCGNAHRRAVSGPGQYRSDLG